MRLAVMREHSVARNDDGGIKQPIAIPFAEASRDVAASCPGRTLPGLDGWPVEGLRCPGQYSRDSVV